MTSVGGAGSPASDAATLYTPMPDPIDSVLLIGFGGPTAPDEIRPFLANVVRGRNVPPERLEGVDIPTFREQGYEVSMSNWRGLVAAPGISHEAKEEFIRIASEVRESEEWQDALERNSWIDSFTTGEEFERYIDKEVTIAQEIVKDLGL